MNGGLRTGAEIERRRASEGDGLGLLSESFVGLRGGVFFGVLLPFGVETMVQVQVQVQMVRLWAGSRGPGKEWKQHKRVVLSYE
jgi:hypothetical protein